MAEKEAALFSPEHIRLASEVIKKFQEIVGDEVLIMAQYGSIVSRNDPQRTLAGRFPMNGENLQDSKNGKNRVVIYNRGMDTTIPHRVSTPDRFVDNFSGTVVHEITHGGSFVRIFADLARNRQFILEWKKEFGWKSVFANVKNHTTGEWEKSKIPAEGWKKNDGGYWQKGEYVVTEEEYTDLPERCIGGSKGYAASVGPQEDICDSITAYLLNPDALVPKKRQFIEKWLAENKSNLDSATKREYH